MKARDLRELGSEELAQKLRETSRELNTMRIKHNSGVAVDKPAQLREMRRDIARIKTVLGARKEQ